MGLDDLVNKAKGLLGQGEDQVAAGTDTTAGAANSGAAGLVGKAKAAATDERIDQVANAIKDKTPDNIDAIVDQAAAKGKDLNN